MVTPAGTADAERLGVQPRRWPTCSGSRRRRPAAPVPRAVLAAAVATVNVSTITAGG